MSADDVGAVSVGVGAVSGDVDADVAGAGVAGDASFSALGLAYRRFVDVNTGNRINTCRW